jgi:hypothetical protein
MDRERLGERLRAEFGDDDGLAVVTRQARDLADSGRYAADIGGELTVETVVRNMADAPDGYSLVERWNWWVGSLDLSHGGYERFRVREDAV